MAGKKRSGVEGMGWGASSLIKNDVEDPAAEERGRESGGGGGGGGAGSPGGLEEEIELSGTLPAGLVVDTSMIAPPTQSWTYYGLFGLLFGLLLFNEGLTYGLNRMGGETGMLIPAAFAENKYVPKSPLFAYGVGLSISVAFAFLLGVGATFAEPALRVLGEKVEELTQGSMKAATLVRSVAAGVSFGVSFGVLKIVYNVDIMWFLVPLYPLACLMSHFSKDEVVAVAWDSAGVTTSEITVPIILSLGLGVGNALHAADGFGILALASIGPIISVLLSGLAGQLSTCCSGERREAI